MKTDQKPSPRLSFHLLMTTTKNMKKMGEICGGNVIRLFLDSELDPPPNNDCLERSLTKTDTPRTIPLVDDHLDGRPEVRPVGACEARRVGGQGGPAGPMENKETEIHRPSLEPRKKMVEMNVNGVL